MGDPNKLCLLYNQPTNTDSVLKGPGLIQYQYPNAQPLPFRWLFWSIFTLWVSESVQSWCQTDSKSNFERVEVWKSSLHWDLVVLNTCLKITSFMYCDSVFYGKITHEWFHACGHKFSHRDPQIAAFKVLTILHWQLTTEENKVPMGWKLKRSQEALCRIVVCHWNLQSLQSIFKKEF